MHSFDTVAGRAMLDLVSSWSRWDVYKDYYLEELVPGFMRDISQANEKERNLLNIIKENLNSEQWDNLPYLLNEAVEYLPVARRKNKERLIREQKEQRERILAEQNRTKLERQRQYAINLHEAKQKLIKKEKEERLLEIRSKAEERREQQEEQRKMQMRQEEERKLHEELLKRQEKEKNKKIKYLENILHKDFSRSQQIWKDRLSDWIIEEEFTQMLTQYVIKWFEGQRWQKPDPEQALCIAEIWDDIQVIARAGSGKTSTIVNRAAFLVKHCKVSPSEILILAFNREAAKELDEKLNKMLPGNKPSAMTFHALAHAIVHPEEELILDDEKQGFTKSRSIQQVIDSYIKDPVWSERIRKLMLKYFRSDWLDIEKGGYHLDPENMVEYRRLLPYIGLDGYYFKSMGEKRIADYLFEHDVSYLYEKNFWWGGLNYKPDFTIPLKNGSHKGIVIEYFGMAGLDTYDHQTEMKKKFWSEQSDYLFISLFPDDIETNQLLDQRVGKPLKKCKLGMQKLTDLQIWHRIRDRAVDEFSKTVSQFIGRCRKQLIYPDDLKAIINNNLQSLSELQIYFLKLVWNIYSEYLRLLVINNEEDFDGLLIRAEEFIKNGHSGWNRKAGSGDLKR